MHEPFLLTNLTQKEKAGYNYEVVFEYNKSNIDGAIAELTDTIKNIERRNFIDSCRNTYSCHYCDLKYFCRKREITEELK